MAVSALPRTRARAHLAPAQLSPGVLILSLTAPALDLFSMVSSATIPSIVAVLATSAAAAALLMVWFRYPRTSWLAAAALGACASLALRLIGADGAAWMSMLTVTALGFGGAFATPARDLDNLLV